MPFVAYMAIVYVWMYMSLSLSIYRYIYIYMAALYAMGLSLAEKYAAAQRAASIRYSLYVCYILKKCVIYVVVLSNALIMFSV